LLLRAPGQVGPKAFVISASWDDAVVSLRHTYRITQYDPADRDEGGAYIGAVDCVSDEGLLEAAYLDAVDAFAREVGVTHLTIRDPQVANTPDDAAYGPDDALVQCFGAGLEGVYDGAVVDIAVTRLIVRGMLRQGAARNRQSTAGPMANSLWCRLEADGQMTVHVGWDMYMYIATTRSCPSAVDATASAGLFPEEIDESPYEPEDEFTRWQAEFAPLDDVFWGRVEALVEARGGVLLEEHAGWRRWHRLTSGDARPELRSRCLVWVWPDFPAHKDAEVERLLGGDPEDLWGYCVWQTPDGRLHESEISSESPTGVPPFDLAMRVWWRDDDASPPLVEGVNPDSDGVIRARWQPWG